MNEISLNCIIPMSPLVASNLRYSRSADLQLRNSTTKLEIYSTQTTEIGKGQSSRSFASINAATEQDLKSKIRMKLRIRQSSELPAPYLPRSPLALLSKSDIADPFVNFRHSTKFSIGVADGQSAECPLCC
jgi:hypothetical protein